MAEVLMVPIHLDALFLKKDRSVVETMADFSRLPYFDGKRDINPDVANLSVRFSRNLLKTAVCN